MFLLALLFLALSANAKVDWEFYNPHEATLYMNVSIGTPGQPFTLRYVINHECVGLFLNKFGGFDPDKSSTYKNTSNYDGTDTFVFQSLDANVQSLPNLEFRPMDGGDGCNYQIPYYLNVARFANKTNLFLNSVFKQSEESIVVFRFNNTPSTYPLIYSGTLTLGGRPDACSPFSYVNANDQASYADWGFPLDRFSVGKFAAVQPGSASLDVSDLTFFMPYDVYSAVSNELNLNLNFLPCNTTTEITITVGGFDMVLKPDDYIDRQFESDGNCMFIGYGWEYSYFVLPYTMLRKNCMAYDFKNDLVGFSLKSN